ncbi:PstS family phosphate ABC transporter substrate-binding protein [Parabacteroides sp. Marseille-P3160]|uniref:PstS family phosphate ABC transporter substrate-binding protein n=1 Tax=Parabacteroides sp. Marseille-P3160 TaxID=1917887 RepID=UPI0009B9899E|nr:substrate-binding domain-containing protein [Parabacteroides sp. Marseille-P3160]
MRKLSLALVILIIVLFSSCRRNKITRTDTPTSGVATIVCDECYAPIVKEELAVFQGMNPDAEITPVFTNEVEAINLLLKDSVRLILAARELSTDEMNLIRERKQIPRVQKLATDGVALIVNNANVDTLISVSTLKKIMSGEITRWSEVSLKGKSDLGDVKVVFDNPNSSTIRFVKDSILKGIPLSDRLVSQPSNADVLDYVSKVPNALGVIGVNWISNPRDTTNLSFTEKVRVVSVSSYDDPDLDNSYKPYPAYLQLGFYPLVRNLYVILTDVRGGLPAGFTHFLGGDIGQRIILKAGLVPATRPTRLISLKETFE